MRQILVWLRRFVILFVVISVASVLVLTAFGLPAWFAVLATLVWAGPISYFAIDLAFAPEDLEDVRRRSAEDDARRSFLDRARRQGPDPRPRGDRR